MDNKVLTMGSLFSGIGGFDLGFERAGFETAWQVEIDPFCNKILARHFPKAKRYGDITKIKTEELEKVDVITGGFPCQDLSVAGKRAGLKGERSGLFFEIKRIVQGLRPAWIVVENVPGLLSSNGGKDFGLVLFHLEECGYGLAWRILDSRYFGVAQRRRRVFIVGCLGKPCPPEILFESEGVSGDFKKKRKAGSDTAGTITGGAGKRGHRISNEDARDNKLIVSQDYKQNGGAVSGLAYDVAPTLYARGAGTDHVASAGNEAQFCIPVVSSTLDTNVGSPDGGDGGDGGLLVPQIAPTLHEGSARDWNDTERGFQIVCKKINPNGMRTASRIPGRLDNTPDSPRYRALGNAVTVNVIYWIAKRISAFVKTPQI